MRELLEKTLGVVPVASLDGWLNRQGKLVPLEHATHYLDACRQVGKKLSEEEFSIWCGKKGLIRIVYDGVDTLNVELFGSKITIPQLSAIRKYAKDADQFQWETAWSHGKDFFSFRKHVLSLREDIGKTLAVDEFDIKKGLRTAAAAGLIGAAAAGIGYQKGISRKPIEKPAITAVAEEPGEWQTVKMQVTAYCPCPKCTGTGSPGITASGHKIKSGDVFVAADKRYPFGTKIIIPGYNDNQPVEVLDRGGAIKGNRIDAFFPTHEEALEWGVKDLDVKVYSD